MRAIGSAERAFELMCTRALARDAFGGPLAEKQFVQDFIARSRIEIDGARLMVLHAAWKMDTEGKRAARQIAERELNRFRPGAEGGPPDGPAAAFEPTPR